MILEDPGQRPIGVYEIVRRFGDLNIKQARKLVDSAPGPILTGMPRRQAEALKLEIEALGAVVDLVSSSG